MFATALYVPHTDSTLVVLPAEPGALQGWNPALAIVDELHVVTRAGLGRGRPCGRQAGPVSRRWRSPHPARPARASCGISSSTAAAATTSRTCYVEYAAPEGCEVDDEDAWA